ncbi:MAG: ribulose-phosphate 3-epimerase [Acidobacteriota bacterium]
MSLLAPSILSADFSRLAEEVAAVKRGGARLVHVDIMDGHFVPNLTVGPAVVRSLKASTNLFLDCHLMVEESQALLPALVEAGADSISVHVEAVRHLNQLIHLIRHLGARAGAALNPGTPLHALDAILADLDFVLIMSVNPGFSGQEFISGSLEKVRTLRRTIQERGLEVSVEVDGGVNLGNARELAEAGASIAVAGSAVFGGGKPEEAARHLAGVLRDAGPDPAWVP